MCPLGYHHGSSMTTPELGTQAVRIHSGRLYNQEFKSEDNLIQVPLDTKLASESLERVHLKFLKWALGVHSKATNVGVWGESGRTPLIYSCIKTTLKYYHRLKNLDDNSLVSLAFQEQQLNNLDC